VKVTSLPGLTLMKIFAWEDRKHLFDKDAKDICFILTRYESVAGKSLWDVEGLMEAETYEPDRAAARLLGRDVAAIMSPPCRAALLAILDRELAPDGAGLLAEQLSLGRVGARSAVEADYPKMQLLLERFRAGLDD
jgi:predicted nucleotidyltransferase